MGDGGSVIEVDEQRQRDVIRKLSGPADDELLGVDVQIALDER